jgi:hypothetical protein
LLRVQIAIALSPSAVQRQTRPVYVKLRTGSPEFARYHSSRSVGLMRDELAQAAMSSAAPNASAAFLMCALPARLGTSCSIRVRRGVTAKNMPT